VNQQDSGGLMSSSGPITDPAALRANNYPLDGSWSSRLSPIQSF
jgi:hypothetical protein